MKIFESIPTLLPNRSNLRQNQLVVYEERPDRFVYQVHKNVGQHYSGRIMRDVRTEDSGTGVPVVSGQTREPDCYLLVAAQGRCV